MGCGSTGLRGRRSAGEGASPLRMSPGAPWGAAAARPGAQGRPRASRAWEAALHTRVSTAGGEERCLCGSRLPDSRANRPRHSAGRAPWPPADRSARCLAPPLASGPRGPAKQRRAEGRRVTAWWRRRSRFSRSESSRHVANRSHYMKPLYRNLAPVGRNYKRCNEMTSDG